MKNLSIPGLLCVFLLAACDPGTETPATEAPEEATTPAAGTEQEAATAPPSEDAANEDEKPTLVEESAAEAEEPEEGEVPLTLAQADTAQASRDWEFTEGQHFTRLVPTQPTIGGADKIEVAEFFWYGCGHCNDFEPYINRWAENKPDNARFVRIPATWNSLVKLHAQLYYTEEVLAKNGELENPEQFHAAVFNEYHGRGNRMTSEDAIRALFARHGVSEAAFDKTWSSFEVAQKLRVAADLARRYGISGVPAIVVNGKYRTGGQQAGSYPRLLEVIDELVERESVR